MESRFLTTAEKIRHLIFYQNLLRDWVAEGKPSGGGRGFPDGNMIDFCNQLNSIGGLCTLQSCSGHVVQAADGSGEYTYPGNLWLRLDEKNSVSFDQRVGDLISSPTIFQVRKLYSYDQGTIPYEVIDITFDRQKVEEAQQIILSFFRSL